MSPSTVIPAGGSKRSLQTEASASNKSRRVSTDGNTETVKKSIGEMVRDLTSSDENVVKAALHGLIKLKLAKNIAVREKVTHSGAGFVIVQTILQNPTSGPILSMACYLIAEMTRNHPKNVEGIIEVGGVQAILKAMTDKHDYFPLGENGCHALLKLSLNSAGKKIMVEQSGIQCILHVIEGGLRHSDCLNAAILRSACVTLTILSEGDNNAKKIILENRGISSFAQAVERFPNDEVLRDNVRDFMDVMLY